MCEHVYTFLYIYIYIYEYTYARNITPIAHAMHMYVHATCISCQMPTTFTYVNACIHVFNCNDTLTRVLRGQSFCLMTIDSHKGTCTYVIMLNYTPIDYKALNEYHRPSATLAP